MARKKGVFGVRGDDGEKEPEEAKRIAPNKNRALQVAPTGRKLFDRERKKIFLEWFAGTANLSLSARKAGVHYRTVLRHRMEKPAFREAFDRALDQAGPRLRAWLVEAEEKEEAELAALDGAGQDSAPVHIDAAQAIQLLRDDAQRLKTGTGGAAGGARGRVPGVASNEEVRRELVRRLRAFGIRARAEGQGESGQ